MKVKCPHCGAVATCPDGFAGKTVDCPECKQPVVGKAYGAGVVIANKAKTEEAAKKAGARPPPEPTGPTVMPIVGGLAAMLGLLSIPVMLVSLNIVGVVLGVVGFLGGLMVMAVAEIQGHTERAAYWAKRIHQELREQSGGEKK